MDYKKIMDSLFKENFELEQQRDQYKAERDTLIDDLSWYKAKVNRLEDGIKSLERENERLRVKSDSFFERWKFKKFMYTDLSKESDKYKSLLSEFSQHIGNKPSSSKYKYFRGKLNALDIREGE